MELTNKIKSQKTKNQNPKADEGGIFRKKQIYNPFPTFQNSSIHKNKKELKIKASVCVYE